MKLLGGSSDLNGVVTDMNQNILEMKNREVTEIFKDDTGVRRVLLGKGANGFYGLKVSKPTFDVFDASDSELIFNSNQNVLKVLASGTTVLTPTNTGAPNYTISTGGYFQSVTFENPDGGTPGVIAFFTSPDPLSSGGAYYLTGNPQTLPVIFTIGAVTMIFSYDVPSPTEARFQVGLIGASLNWNSPPDFSFTYYILQETAN